MTKVNLNQLTDIWTNTKTTIPVSYQLYLNRFVLWLSAHQRQQGNHLNHFCTSCLSLVAPSHSALHREMTNQFNCYPHSYSSAILFMPCRSAPHRTKPNRYCCYLHSYPLTILFIPHRRAPHRTVPNRSCCYPHSYQSAILFTPYLSAPHRTIPNRSCSYPHSYPSAILVTPYYSAPHNAVSNQSLYTLVNSFFLPHHSSLCRIKQAKIQMWITMSNSPAMIVSLFLVAERQNLARRLIIGKGSYSGSDITSGSATGNGAAPVFCKTPCRITVAIHLNVTALQ